MRKKKEWLIISALLLLLLVGAGTILFATSGSRDEARADLSTFGGYTDLELFQSVPTMSSENAEYTKARDVGDGNYMIHAECTTKEDYDAYLKLLEAKGYTKYIDNGEEGMEGNIYSAYYQKEDLTLYVCYFANIATTMINVCSDAKFSEHLFYDESYVSDNIAGMKTTLHSPELYQVGNSFLVQLKNGHFILNDGGSPDELPYLVDYMESLAPNGEKPVIEAWFISHSHYDHMGILHRVIEEPSYAERFYVENIYFNTPTPEAYANFRVFDDPYTWVTMCKSSGTYFKTTTGEQPTVYRPRIGEKYYFNDITIDVIYSPELLEPEDWRTWNASSFVLTYHIEGQKVLLTADTEYNCQKIYMKLFNSEYFDLDVYQMPHHGKNVYIEFASYCERIQTLIYPTYVIGAVGASGENISPQNQYFEAKAEESLSYGTGTKVLTFPYSVGECVTLPRQEWIYDETPSWVNSK